MTEKESDGLLLLQYRLKTARRKKRLVKKAHEKMLRKLYRHRQNIGNEIRNLGWEELNPPYQRGWKRTFVLKAEIGRSKQADFFEALLTKINTVQHSSRKDFKKKKRVKRKRVYVNTKQELRKMHEHEMKKFTEAELGYFTKVVSYCIAGKRWETRYVITEPNRFFQLKVMPNMITKVRKKDLALESTLAELNKQIERKNLEPAMYKLMDGNYGNWVWKMHENAKYKNPLRNMPVEKIVDEYVQFDN